MSYDYVFKSMYYDYLDECYTTKRSPFSSPNRYMKIIEGFDNNTYIETWDVDLYGKEMRLDIAYSLEEYHDAFIHNEKLQFQCRKNDCTPIRVRSLRMPQKEFCKIANEIELKSDD